MTANETPAAQGYHWPAEWDQHAGTWLSWPHNRETWPDRFEPIPAVFTALVRALEGRELVHVNAGSEALEDEARRALRSGGVDADRAVRFHRIATNDAWARDHGGIVVVREHDGRRERAIVDFGFDSWGKKYGPWDLDDAVPKQMAAALGLPLFESGLVLEGGSIEGNGRGTILTTESCLLNPNRGAGRTRESMERVLADWLGARHVLWLGDGIEGDDTDGHIDDLTRFVDATTVVTAVEESPSDTNYAPLAANLARLRGMRDQDGKPLAIATLPMPPPLHVGGQRCPASYANFYLANGVALVPTFRAPSDARALAVLREVLPGRDVIGIDCTDLVWGLGAIHCVTQQIPA
jgi:agmatine deiminase